MKIDVSKIDEKIRMLEAIKVIASNPEMISLLEDVLTASNGASPLVHAPAVQQRTPDSPKAPKLARGTFIRGALKQAVLAAIQRQTKPFTGYDLTEGILAEGSYTFTASTPALAVNDVLRTLLKNKQEIKIHHKGKGGMPHNYTHLKPQVEAIPGRASGD